MSESNIDRLLNYEQGERIIGKLQDIAGNVAMNIPIPVPLMTEFDYDGTPKTLQFTNLNVERTIVIDETATDAGPHTTSVYLKNSNDKWFDGTTAAKTYDWNIYDTSWAYASDSKIVELVAAADAGECDLEQDYGWTIGDERLITISPDTAPGASAPWTTLSGTSNLILMDTDHFDLVTPVASGSKCHFVGGFENIFYSMYTNNYQEHTSYVGSGRYNYTHAFYNSNCLPEYIKTITKPFYTYSCSTTPDAEDMSIFSAIEIGNMQATNYPAYAATDQYQSQIEYFKSSSNYARKSMDTNTYRTYIIRTMLNNSGYCSGVTAAGELGPNAISINAGTKSYVFIAPPFMVF